MICPFCMETIIDGAIKCKHCKTFIKDYIDGVSKPRRCFEWVVQPQGGALRAF